ncbi:MAG: glutamate synthase central domain-containing protein, partial [Verrucomicrobiota bacterium]
MTSYRTTVGAEQNLFDETEQHCHQFDLHEPILTNEQVEQLRHMEVGDVRTTTLPLLFKIDQGGEGLKTAMNNLCKAAEDAVKEGASILILSDRDFDEENAPIPALLATAGIHHYLIRQGLRTRCGLVLESGEPREVHHYCCLFAYGAGAVNPYLAFETLDDLLLRGRLGEEATLEDAIEKYIKSIGDGILKVISKMGISTLHSYRGAQILEALGLNRDLVDEYFTGTASRIGGIGIDVVAEEVRHRHHHAYPERATAANLNLDVGGKYQWRRNGEFHFLNPHTVAKLQIATKVRDEETYREYADLINQQSRELGTLRGLMDFKTLPEPIPLDEVEPWTEIVKRFKTGAMSYGSISKESHETLAIAMNRIGGKSNSGEGGEDPDRFEPDENGDWRNSAIKQIASGRFGVTSNYLGHARELQIKMAQGAKPGEGGELPGFKVYPWVAKTRHTTPWVGLISPPPHHDIYSIE